MTPMWPSCDPNRLLCDGHVTYHVTFPVQGSVPCVLFIDEVDVICLKRETAQREMEKRIVSQLLACVDGRPHVAAV